MGYCADPNSQKEIQTVLKKMHADWRQKGLPKPKNIKALDKFKRHNQTHQLADLFDSIT